MTRGTSHNKCSGVLLRMMLSFIRCRAACYRTLLRVCNRGMVPGVCPIAQRRGMDSETQCYRAFEAQNRLAEGHRGLKLLQESLVFQRGYSLAELLHLLLLGEGVNPLQLIAKALANEIGVVK